MSTTVTDIADIIATELGIKPEEVLTAESLADLGVDSLGLIDLIFAVEKRFNIEIPNALLQKVASLQDLSHAVDTVMSGMVVEERLVNA